MMKLTVDAKLNNDKDRIELHNMLTAALMNRKCRRTIGKNEMLNHNKLSMPVDTTFGNRI